MLFPEHAQQVPASLPVTRLISLLYPIRFCLKPRMLPYWGVQRWIYECTNRELSSGETPLSTDVHRGTMCGKAGGLGVGTA